MSFLEIDGNRHSIPPGDSSIGSDPSNLIALMGEGVQARHLLIQGTDDGQVSVSRTGDATTSINGVTLGPQPAPLLHGDKIEIGAHELLFVDERRSGSTQFVRAEDLAKLQALGGARQKKRKIATAATGGRLVSLTDGREYAIVSTIVMGREAGCDVVITSKRVSRRHAEITPTSTGYMLIDTSTNGTFVNSDRIQGERLLARTDVIRMGDDEFRFYADIAREEPVPAPAPEQAAPPPVAPPPQAPPAPVAVTPPPASSPPPAPAPPSAPEGAAFQLNNTMHGLPPGIGIPKPTDQTKPSTAPLGAQQQLNHTMHGIPSPAAVPPNRPTVASTPQGKAPAPPASPTPRPTTGQASQPSGAVLANLLARNGDLKGTRFPIKVPVVNIGRADYNDIVINDATVSTIHAKLQRREGLWVLVDLDSTNGTFVDGEQVKGETPIAPGAIVRFGDISTVFEPMDDNSGMGGGGSTTVLGAIKPAAVDPAGPPVSDGGKKKGGLWPFR